jgi:hypothetical protein
MPLLSASVSRPSAFRSLSRCCGSYQNRRQTFSLPSVLPARMCASRLTSSTPVRPGQLALSAGSASRSEIQAGFIVTKSIRGASVDSGSNGPGSVR